MLAPVTAPCRTSRSRNSTFDFGPRTSVSAGASRRRCSASARLRSHDELGDHRVVEDRDRVALGRAGVDAHMARRCRQAQRGERARARQESPARVLRVQAQFDGVAVGRHALVAHERAGQGFARGHAQLQFDQVEPEVISVTGCSTCGRVLISMK